MKKLFALILAFCLVLTMLPAPAFAEGEPEAPICTCETACTAEKENTACPVCGAEDATPDVCTYSPPVTYKVIYQFVEGSMSVILQTDVVKAGEATPAFRRTLNREGFLFAGWDPAVAETVTADATYTAKWAEARTITYTSGTQHKLFEDETYTAKDGDSTPVFSLGLNSFTSWKITDWNPQVAATVNGNATYTAQWEAKGANKLVLDANGGTLKEGKSDTETVEGTIADFPPIDDLFDPPENYTYKTSDSWNTEKSGTGTAYEGGESAMVFTAEHNEETVTLYAQWEPTTNNKPAVEDNDVQGILDTYKVKVAIVGDDTFSIDKDAKDVAGAYAVKGNDAVGYTLEVTLSLDATTETACETAINAHYTTSGETAKTGDWQCVAPKSQTVSFKWDADNGGWIPPEGTSGSVIATFYMNQYFTVTYTDGVRGECFDDQVTSVAKGAATPAFEGTPTRTGYTFDGWDKDVAKTVTADVTYTAKWKAKTYTVKFYPDAEDVTGTMADQTLTYDKAEKLTKNAFTREGYTFTGWNTQADGTGTGYTDGQEVTNLTAQNGETVTLYAQWKAHSYTISFHANGGKGDMAKQTMTYGKTANLTALGFTREGYRFTGWTTKADGTGLLFGDEEPVSNLTSADGGTIDLYAQWVKVIDRVDLALSGHELDKRVDGVKLTSEERITFNGAYGSAWGIATNKNTLKTLEGKVFQADTQYYLWVIFSPEEGCTLEGLTAKDVTLDGTAALSLEDMQGSKMALFRLPVIYTITVTAGKNGSVSSDSTINAKGVITVFEGEDVTIKITPDSGYVVYRLTVDGQSVKTARTYTFENIQQSHTLRARFLKNGTNAKTGDSFPLAPAIAVLALSAAALAAIFVITKKKKQK